MSQHSHIRHSHTHGQEHHDHEHHDHERHGHAHHGHEHGQHARVATSHAHHDHRPAMPGTGVAVAPFSLLLAGLTQRLIFALCALAVLWPVTYWALR